MRTQQSAGRTPREVRLSVRCWARPGTGRSAGLFSATLACVCSMHRCVGCVCVVVEHTRVRINTLSFLRKNRGGAEPRPAAPSTPAPASLWGITAPGAGPGLRARFIAVNTSAYRKGYCRLVLHLQTRSYKVPDVTGHISRKCACSTHAQGPRSGGRPCPPRVPHPAGTLSCADMHLGRFAFTCDNPTCPLGRERTG